MAKQVKINVSVARGVDGSYTMGVMNAEAQNTTLIGGNNRASAPAPQFTAVTGIDLPVGTSKVYRMELIPQRKKAVKK